MQNLFLDLAKLNSQEKTIAGLEVLSKLLENIVNFPNDKKYRCILKSNKAVSSKLLSLKGVLPLLKQIGYTDLGPDKLELCPEALGSLPGVLSDCSSALSELKVDFEEAEKQRHQKHLQEIKNKFKAQEAEKKRILQQAHLDREEFLHKHL